MEAGYHELIEPQESSEPHHDRSVRTFPVFLFLTLGLILVWIYGAFTRLGVTVNSCLSDYLSFGISHLCSSERLMMSITLLWVGFVLVIFFMLRLNEAVFRPFKHFKPWHISTPSQCIHTLSSLLHP